MKQTLHGIYDFHEMLDISASDGTIAWNRIAEEHLLYLKGKWYCLSHFVPTESSLIACIQSTREDYLHKLEIDFHITNHTSGKSELFIDNWTIIEPEKVDPKEYEKVKDFGLF